MTAPHTPELVAFVRQPVLPNCPTPWCDHSEPPHVWQGASDQYTVICSRCQVEGPYRDTEAEAVDAWFGRECAA